METPCAFLKPPSAVKGQGCVVLLLVLTAGLWLPGRCQLVAGSNSSQPAPTPFSTPLSLLLETSFAPDVALTEDSAVGPSPTLDSLEATDSGLRESPSSPHLQQIESSVFLSSSISVFPTSTHSAYASLLSSDGQAGVTVSSASATQTAGNFGFTDFAPESSDLGLVIHSTPFIDSVAATLRWIPTRVYSKPAPLSSNVRSAYSETLDTATATSTTEPGNSTATEGQGSQGFSVLVTPVPPSSTSDVLSVLIPSATQDFLSDAVGPTLAPSVLPADSAMLSMNSTPPSLHVETTSPVWQGSAGVNSPASASGNVSCSDKEAGCGEFKLDDDEDEEELRVKVIVGVACGAILLVVIIGVVVGYMYRRRGKMSSGSKIDLSSYWDDSVTLSYINGHIDIPKDNTDEMISLDNDSFLNSLDSMSFTNTWTSDTSKHTNF